MQQQIQIAKTGGDLTAVSAAVLSFFKAIPWPEIAAFLSAVYLVVRIFYAIKNKGKE